MKLKEFLTPGQTLSQRVIYGGIWVFALRITNRLFGLGRTVVLARLLAPDDFGLMGIALLAMSAMESLSQTGFQQALIQKRKDIKPYLDTVWTIQVIRSIILFGILFAAAPAVAAFFDAPKATVIIRVIAIAQLLKGFTNIGVVYFRKELEFHKQFAYEFSSTIADLAVAIPVALILRSVWALVFGLLAGNFIRFAMSYVIHPYRPKVVINWKKFRELFRFGKWILGYTIIVFLAAQGDDVFLGKILGVTALGLYQMAFRISNLVKTEIAMVISQVTYPAFSRLQEDIPRLRDAFLRTLEMTAFLSVPIAAGILFLGTDFTRIFLGEKWMPMVPAMQIMAASGLIHAIFRITGPLFESIGRPHIVFWMNLARVGGMGAVIYPLTTSLGLKGTAIAVLLGMLVTIPIWWFKSVKLIEVTSRTLLKRIVPSLVGASVMGVVIMALRHLLGEVRSSTLFLLILIGTVSYLSFILLFWKKFKYGPICNLQILRKGIARTTSVRTSKEDP